MKYQNRLNKQDEDNLVLAAAKGDLEAFNQLVLNYQDLAYNHAFSILGDPASAEDAAQDGFIKTFQGMNTFRGGSFRSWLLRIVTNCAYDLIRRSRRQPAQPLYPVDDDGEESDSPTWIADPSASVQGAVEQKALSEDLYRLMDELPEVYRSVLTLVDVYELDYTETAKALMIPLGTVKSRLARARLQMQGKLKQTVHGDDLIAGTQPCLAV
jgi:RNA polymerase sigma-70 factor (ECF subfamily)